MISRAWGSMSWFCCDRPDLFTKAHFCDRQTSVRCLQKSAENRIQPSFRRPMRSGAHSTHHWFGWTGTPLNSNEFVSIWVPYDAFFGRGPMACDTALLGFGPMARDCNLILSNTALRRRTMFPDSWSFPRNEADFNIPHISQVPLPMVGFVTPTGSLCVLCSSCLKFRGCISQLISIRFPC